MPFRWTINPYRGCSHACVYCIERRHGDPAGRRARPPDRTICGPATRSTGPSVRGTYRHYVRTEVRRTLEDREAGLQDRPRGRHRARRERRSPVPHDAWLEVRHRCAAGPGRRPHLTIGSELLGTGRFAGARRALRRLPARLSLRHGPRATGTSGATTTSARSRERRCPSVPPRAHRRRGAGPDPGVPGAGGRQDRPLRLRPGDRLATGDRRPSGRRRANGCTASARSSRGRSRPTEAWRKGFLAGVFDAEGSANGVVRIANTDPEMIGWTSDCLAATRVRRHRRGHLRPTCASLRAPPRRSVRRAAVHAHGRSRDQPQARPRGPRVEDGCRTRCRRDRAAARRRASSSTSPPAPATSSPTASSATTASPAPPTSTSA